MEGLSNKGIFLLIMSMVLIVVVGVILVAPVLREAEPKPECVCKAEACPVAPVCPPSIECPPQPTLEIHKPLSEEVDAIAAECVPKLAEALAAMKRKMREVAEAVNAARTAGVDSQNYDWVADPDAAAAGMRLVELRSEMYDVMYGGEDFRQECNTRMQALVSATDGWKAVNDAWDAEWKRSRDNTHDFYEVVGEYPFSFSCNVVAGHMQCPIPDPPAE